MLVVSSARRRQGAARVGSSAPGWVGSSIGMPMTHPAPRTTTAAAPAQARHPYLALLRRGDVLARFGAVFASAVALGMMSLTVVLCVTEWTGSLALAGAASGMFSLGNAAGVALQGRFLDGARGRAVLRAAGTTCVVAIAVFVAAGSRSGPTALVLASAGAAGVSVPALTAAVRAWLPRVLHDDGVRAASYALLSVAFQAAIAVGPLVVSACLLLAGPEVAAVVAAALVGTATVLYLATTRERRAPVPAARPLPPAAHGRFFTPGLLLVLGVIGVLGACFGSLLVTVPATMTARGTPALAGVAMAAVAVGEVVGALVYGARRWRASYATRLVVVLALLGASYATAAMVAGTTPALVAAVALSGAATGPAAIMLSALVDHVVDPGSVARGYAALVSANLVAIAAGSALTGLVADHLAPAALLAAPAALSVLAAGACVLTRRAVGASA